MTMQRSKNNSIEVMSDLKQRGLTKNVPAVFFFFFYEDLFPSKLN